MLGFCQSRRDKNYNLAMLKRKSRILDEMHQTATGLHGAGLISKRRMGEFDALCRLDVHEMAPKKIKSLLEDSRLSQAVSAEITKVS